MKRFTYFLLKIVLLPILGVHVYTQAQDLQECPETDPYNPGNRLVVIGDSFPSGYHDANEFPESQRWVYPSYIAERLGATYSVPELRIGMASGGITAPDIRSVFSPTGFVMSPYFGMFDLPPIDEKAHPGELHPEPEIPVPR